MVFFLPKKLALIMACATYTPVEFYIDMLIDELLEYADMLLEIKGLNKKL